MSSRPYYSIIAATIAVALALAGCDKKEDKPAQNAALRIGIIEPLTGAAASFGDPHHKGTQLAVEEINKAGGFNGRPLEVFDEDDKSDPTTGINVVKKLISQDHVAAIVGTPASLVAIALSKENEKSKVPMVNGQAGSPTLTEQGYKYVWRIKITDTQLDVKAIEYYVQNKHVKKIAFLVENSDYGKPPTKAAADRAKELGADVVAYEEYNRGETDFKAQLTNIANKAPEILFVHGYPNEGSIIARQIRQLGIKTQLVLNEGQGTAGFLALAGDAADGAVFPTTWLPGLTDERSKHFEAAFRDRYHSEPGAFAAGAYESVYTVLEAARKGGGVSSADIQNGLGKLQGFQTLLGPIHFDQKNQNDGQVTLAHFNGNKIEPLK